MRCIFLLFCAIAWQVLSPGSGFAQPQIDSVRVEMKDLQFYNSSSYTSFSHGSGSSHETVVSSSNYTQIIVQQFTSAGTIVLVCKSRDTIKFMIDTVQNIMGSFKEYYSDISTDEGSQHSISFINATVENVGDNVEVNMDTAALTSDKFSYIYNSITHSSGGEEDHNSSTYTGSVPTSHVKVILYKHVPLNSIENSINKMLLFRLFPNPASKFITLYSSENNYYQQASIFDLLGNQVLKKDLENLQIDVSSLPPGIYYLRAGNQMQKFVIQR
jgi:hypothetical protein